MTKMTDPWAEIKALRMHAPPEQTVEPIKPNRVGMLIASALRKGKDLGNAPGRIPESVPLVGGMGVGDLLFGDTPEMTEDWAHGFPPYSGQGYGAQVDPRAIDYVGLPLAGTGAALTSRAVGRGLRNEMVGDATAPQSGVRKIIDELRQQPYDPTDHIMGDLDDEAAPFASQFVKQTGEEGVPISLPGLLRKTADNDEAYRVPLSEVKGKWTKKDFEEIEKLAPELKDLTEEDWVRWAKGERPYNKLPEERFDDFMEYSSGTEDALIARHFADSPADPSRREFLKNTGAAAAVGLVAANTPDILRRMTVRAVPKIVMPREAPTNVAKQLLYGASPKVSARQTQIIDAAVDKMDPKYMKDIAEYLEGLDWEKAVPGAERRFAMSIQDLKRKDLGLPRSDAIRNPKDYWDTDVDGWTTKSSKAKKSVEILESLTPEELGNWVISGKPPKGKFTDEQLMYLGVEDIVSQIDRVTPITYTKGTLFWRNLPDEAKAAFYSD